MSDCQPILKAHQDAGRPGRFWVCNCGWNSQWIPLNAMHEASRIISQHLGIPRKPKRSSGA